MQLNFTSYSPDQILDAYKTVFANWLSIASQTPDYKKNNPLAHITEELVMELRTQYLDKPGNDPMLLIQEESTIKLSLSNLLRKQPPVFDALCTALAEEMKSRFSLSTDF